MAITLVYGNNKKNNYFPHLNTSLFSLTHAGQEGHGFAVSDGRQIRTGSGKYTPDLLSGYNRLKGFTGVGQNSGRCVVEPVVYYTSKLGNFALAFDGYFKNGRKLRKKSGGSTDAETAARFIADSNSFERGVKNLEEASNGFFCITLVTEKGEAYAARSSLGIRPLIYGGNEDSHVIATESRPLDKLRILQSKNIRAGEIVAIDNSGIHTLEQMEDNMKLCTFLWAYYQMPDSVLYDLPVHREREIAGEILGRNDKGKFKIDIAGPVPDSALYYEEGYAKGYECPHGKIFTKYQFAGRSYDRPKQSYRDLIASIKISILNDKVRGKDVAVLEDSIRRGTQIVRPYGPIWHLKQAGAKSIHLRPGSPRNTAYCRLCPPDKGRFYDDDNLAANKFPTDKALADHLKIDSVRFIELDPFLNIITEGTGLKRENLCHGCYTGEFPFLK